MREIIIEKSCELFLNLGFKSVTMDEIANALGISKKTLYKYFSNKTDLVTAVTNTMFEKISCGIDHVCGIDLNPIDEIFAIKKLVMEHLKDEKSSPQYQLQKYYPKLFLSLKQKQFQIMQKCVIENLERGVKLGIYREDIDVDFISRIYFIGITGIKDNDMFPLKNYVMKSLMNQYLDYHLRGICTPKGIFQLEKQLKEN
jgi:AcrR family transcriptional regulator